MEGEAAFCNTKRESYNRFRSFIYIFDNHSLQHLDSKKDVSSLTNTEDCGNSEIILRKRMLLMCTGTPIAGVKMIDVLN